MGTAKLFHIHPIGGDEDFVGRYAPRDKVAAQSFANDRHRIRPAHRARFEPTGQPIFDRPLTPCAIADRRILPKGAYFIKERQARAIRHRLRSQRAEHRRMDMQYVGRKFGHHFAEPAAQHQHAGLGTAQPFKVGQGLQLGQLLLQVLRPGAGQQAQGVAACVLRCRERDV